MKNPACYILPFVLLVSANAALAATTDDVKWINQCVSDNKNEGAKAEVVLKYCTCMNNKMSDNETQSITQWEKTHVAERKVLRRGQAASNAASTGVTKMAETPVHPLRDQTRSAFEARDGRRR